MCRYKNSMKVEPYVMLKKEYELKLQQYNHFNDKKSLLNPYHYHPKFFHDSKIYVANSFRNHSHKNTMKNVPKASGVHSHRLKARKRDRLIRQIERHEQLRENKESINRNVVAPYDLITKGEENKTFKIKTKTKTGNENTFRGINKSSSFGKSIKEKKNAHKVQNLDSNIPKNLNNLTHDQNKQSIPHKNDLDKSYITDPRHYTGYIIDLLNQICAMLGIEYDVIPVADNEYGQKKADGSWTGVVKELVHRRADLAAAPMFVTSQRRKAVHFSMPFLHVRGTILLHKKLLNPDLQFPFPPNHDNHQRMEKDAFENEIGYMENEETNFETYNDVEFSGRLGNCDKAHSQDGPDETVKNEESGEDVSEKNEKIEFHDYYAKKANKKCGNRTINYDNHRLITTLDVPNLKSSIKKFQLLKVKKNSKNINNKTQRKMSANNNKNKKLKNVKQLSYYKVNNNGTRKKDKLPKNELNKNEKIEDLLEQVVFGTLRKGVLLKSLREENSSRWLYDGMTRSGVFTFTNEEGIRMVREGFDASKWKLGRSVQRFNLKKNVRKKDMTFGENLKVNYRFKRKIKKNINIKSSQDKSVDDNVKIKAKHSTPNENGTHYIKRFTSTANKSHFFSTHKPQHHVVAEDAYWRQHPNHHYMLKSLDWLLIIELLFRNNGIENLNLIFKNSSFLKYLGNNFKTFPNHAVFERDKVLTSMKTLEKLKKMPLRQQQNFFDKQDINQRSPYYGNSLRGLANADSSLIRLGCNKSPFQQPPFRIALIMCKLNKIWHLEKLFCAKKKNLNNNCGKMQKKGDKLEKLLVEMYCKLTEYLLARRLKCSNLIGHLSKDGMFFKNKLHLNAPVFVMLKEAKAVSTEQKHKENIRKRSKQENVCKYFNCALVVLGCIISPDGDKAPEELSEEGNGLQCAKSFHQERWQTRPQMISGQLISSSKALNSLLQALFHFKSLPSFETLTKWLKIVYKKMDKQKKSHTTKLTSDSKKIPSNAKNTILSQFLNSKSGQKPQINTAYVSVKTKFVSKKNLARSIFNRKIRSVSGEKMPFHSHHATKNNHQTISNAQVSHTNSSKKKVKLKQTERNFNTITKKMGKKLIKKKQSPSKLTSFFLSKRHSHQAHHSGHNDISQPIKRHFGFILPHTIGDYVSRLPPCDLVAVGKLFMHENFSFAVPKNSGLLLQLDNSLKKLRDNGFLDALYKKWISNDELCERYLSATTGGSDVKSEIIIQQIQWNFNKHEPTTNHNVAPHQKEALQVVDKTHKIQAKKKYIKKTFKGRLVRLYSLSPSSCYVCKMCFYIHLHLLLYFNMHFVRANLT